ncbi:MAG: hypothetical protein QOG31_784 [Thermoplasmata archaeon]|jgi:hypothetical protein|nr:hypothetical protein [Thermoplasmata archaeon]
MTAKRAFEQAARSAAGPSGAGRKGSEVRE